MSISIGTLNQEIFESLNQDALENNRIIDKLKFAERKQVQVINRQNYYAFFDTVKFELLIPTRSSDGFVLDCCLEIPKFSRICSIEAPKASSKSIIEKFSAHGNYNVSYVDLMNLEDLSILDTKIPEINIVKGPDFPADGLELIAAFSKERLGKNLSLKEAEAIAKSERREFFGIQFENEVVSIGALTRASLQSRCISYVYTRPNFRRSGYSKLLLNLLIRSARGNYSSLFLHVDEENHSARSLYRSLGFKSLVTHARIRVIDADQIMGVN